MRIKQLLTKTLLAAAGLCVGASAWAETKTVYSWTFTGYGSTVWLPVTNSASPITALSAETYPCSVAKYEGLYLEGTSSSTDSKIRMDKSGGIRAYTSGGNVVAIPGLKEGDAIKVLGSIYNNNGSQNIVQAVSDNATLTTNSATDFDIKMKANGDLGIKLIYYAANKDAYYSVSSIVVTREIAAGTCEDPEYKITGANGIKRTFTLTCPTEGASIYYSDTEKTVEDTGWSTYTTAVETSAGTIWAYAEASGAKSSVISFSTGAGSEASLSGVTYSRPYYDIATNKYCVKVAESQTGIIGSPTATLTYYTDDENNQTECTSGSFIKGFALGETVYVVASASGYASTTTSFTFPSTLPAEGMTASWTDVFTSGEELTVGEGVTMGNVSCSPVTAIGETTLSGNIGLYAYNTTRWTSTTDGITSTNAYYVGAQNLQTTGFLKFVVNANTFENGLISGRKDATLNYSEKNTDGTYSMYFNVSNSHVCFNGSNGLNIKSASYVDFASVSPSVTDYATFSSPYALDFTSATGVKAYYASASDGSAVTMTKVTSAVAAGTGLLLQKVDGAISIPVAATGTDLSATNLLKAGTGADVVSDAEYSRYVLAGEGDATSFYNLATAYAVPVGKAYLEVAKNAGARLAIVFSDGETTGIANVEKTSAVAEGIYNLNGQRVVAPQKGLYIVNGKKVIKK